MGRLWTEVAGEETLERDANRVRLGVTETRGEREGGGTETGTVARLRIEGEGDGEAGGENVFGRCVERVGEKREVDGRLERLWTEEGDAASERREARLWMGVETVARGLMGLAVKGDRRSRFG